MGIGKTDHFSYIKCTKCGTLFNSQYPNENTLNKLYENMPANMEEEVNDENQTKNQNEYAKKLFEGLQLVSDKNKENSFIEIGADRGLLIRELKGLLGVKFSKSVGIEPNKVVLNELEMVLKESSLEYESYEDIEIMGDEGNNEFNLSACIHILDHCYEPQKLLLNINKKLIFNGILLIVVHNPDSS